MFKRRRMKKTDYRQRLALLKSGKPRLIVRRSLNNFHASIVVFEEKGDRTLAETSSKALRNYGWKAHCGSTSAAYLTGLLIGAEARKAKVSDVILDLGLQKSTESSLYAVVAGLRDAGVRIPVGEVLPAAERISGRHTADYAAKLKKEDPEKYKKQFSQYIKNGVDPEKFGEHFESVKKKIIEEAGINLQKKIAVKNGDDNAEGEEKWEDSE